MIPSAELQFKNAQRLFEARDFISAVSAARDAAASVREAIQVRDIGEVCRTAIYSIVVVMYERQDDLAEALTRIARYSSMENFEIIFVNNGCLTEKDLLPFIKNFRFVDVGFNYGCCGGRNVGADVSIGDYLIFLEDDGLLAPYAIENLIDVITKHDALATRGRVLPKTSLAPGVIGRDFLTAEHYDLGDEIVYSVPNTEGISIWRRREFIKAGGFDTLLAGGEGVALWSKMYKAGGPCGFMYAPTSILFHDYAAGKGELKSKKARYRANEAYLSFAYPTAESERWKATLEFTCHAANSNRTNAGVEHYRGGLLRRLERFKEAEDAQRQAIKLNPDFGEAHMELSCCLAQRGSWSDAIAAARRAVQCDPENATYHYNFGEFLHSAGQLREAELALRQALSLRPDFSMAYKRLSEVHTDQGRENEALAMARRAIECDPENANYHYNLGGLLHRAGQVAEAELALRQALSHRPDFGMAYKRLSEVYADQGRENEALAMARRAIECDSENANYHHNLGRFLHRTGQLGEAELALRRAVSLRPDFGTSYKRLSEVHADQGQQEEALAAARRAIECDPENATYHDNLAKCLHCAARLVEAESALHQALSLRPDFGIACRRLSEVYADQRRENEALAMARRAIECEPENAEYHYFLGRLLQSFGKSRDAEAALCQAVRLKPDLGIAYRQLSKIYAEQERRNDARAAARRARECDRGSGWQRRNLGNLLLDFTKFLGWR